MVLAKQGCEPGLDWYPYSGGVKVRCQSIFTDSWSQITEAKYNNLRNRWKKLNHLALQNFTFSWKNEHEP